MIHRPTPKLLTTFAADTIRINCSKLYKNNMLIPNPNFSHSASQLSKPAAHAFPVVSFLIAKFPFFSKFLLMIALTSLVFAGQALAQGLSLTHVTDGTPYVVSGPAGTTFVVELSVTGLTLPAVNGYAFDFDFDSSLLRFVSAVDGNGNDLTNLLGTPTMLYEDANGDPAKMVPPAVLMRATFTTRTAIAADQAFSIGIDPASVTIPGLDKTTLDLVKAAVAANPPVAMFNADDGMPDPTPPDPTPPDPTPPDPTPPAEQQLHLDTQIESPEQNNSVLTFTDNRPGDTLQIQLFVPDAAGQNIQAFALELALQGKTFDRFIGSISGSDWMGESLLSGLSASDNPTLSGLFLNAASVPVTGYLGQIDLEVTGVLTDEDKLRITRASLAVAGGTLQSLDVSNAELSFVPVSLCPGDFDDNEMVNMADFLLFGPVFGTRSSDAGYNALMDMDDSGAIDVADFLLFVKVFNTTCGQPPPGGGGGGGQTGVSIPDANLRAVIEDSLDKASGAPISRAEMVNLTRLVAQNKGIRDLTGLEYAVNLTWLDLGEEQVSSSSVANRNSFSDLSPLANLTRLTWLNLAYNDNISDLSSLSGLTNLTELYLTGQLSDLSPLSGLTRLTNLSLNSTAISDISPLKDLINLKELLLDGPSTAGTAIEDLSPLSDLTSLTKLSLDGNRISDISPLSDLTNLTELYFGFAPISDISPLSDLTNLTRLGFRVSQISDISPLSGLTNLIWLNFSFGDISDISPLKDLTNLTYVGLFHCEISDLAPLVANTGLGDGDEVNVKNNPLSTTSREMHIPALRDRGVTVLF